MPIATIGGALLPVVTGGLTQLTGKLIDRIGGGGGGDNGAAEAERIRQENLAKRERELEALREKWRQEDERMAKEKEESDELFRRTMEQGNNQRNDLASIKKDVEKAQAGFKSAGQSWQENGRKLREMVEDHRAKLENIRRGQDKVEGTLGGIRTNLGAIRDTMPVLPSMSLALN